MIIFISFVLRVQLGLCVKPSDVRRNDPSLLLVLKWGGELTPAGRVQAEELGRAFRCMYPGGQGRPLSVGESHPLKHPTDAW